MLLFRGGRRLLAKMENMLWNNYAVWLHSKLSNITANFILSLILNLTILTLYCYPLIFNKIT
jgi:site-specific recombinase